VIYVRIYFSKVSFNKKKTSEFSLEVSLGMEIVPSSKEKT